MQPRRDHPAVLAPVGLQQVERRVDVRDERAPPDRAAAVLEAGRAGGHLVRRHVHVRDRSRGAGRRGQVREDRVDRRGETAGEERRHADREQQVDRRPVAAADRAVALEVLDRVRREELALVAVERDEDRPQVAMQREPVAHPEQRVHEPAEAEHPRVFRDRLVDRGVAVRGDDLEVRLDAAAPALGPRPAPQLLEQVDQLLAAVQADALVADEMAERRDRLDVVADVGGRLRRGRVAVVHHRERPPPAGRRGRRRRVGLRRDPWTHPVAVQLAVAPERRVLAARGARRSRTRRARAPPPRAPRRRRGSRASSWPAPRRDPRRRAHGSRAAPPAGATVRPERTYSAGA